MKNCFGELDFVFKLKNFTIVIVLTKLWESKESEIIEIETIS